MENFEIILKCSRCGSELFEHPADSKDNDMITCNGCGALTKYGVARESAIRQARELAEKRARDIISSFKTRTFAIRCLITLIGTLLFTSTAYAVDATSSATEVLKSKRWLLIEFAAQQQLIYRVSSQATNSENSYLAIDFAPSRKCVPTPAVMSSIMSSYSSALDDGLVPISYRPPGQSETTEVTKTSMTPGDDVAFFQFKGLTAGLLLKSRDKGSLAVWIPGNGDDSVKRSNNTYFSLDGFTTAYTEARKRCNDNR